MKKNIFSFPNFLLFFCVLILVILHIKPPYPITYDEAKEGYTAYSISKTLKDTNGITLPLLFKTDNEYVSSASVYLKIPVVSIFGINTTAIRWLALVSAFTALFAFYKLAKLILKDKIKAKIAAAFLVISPLFIFDSIFNLGEALALAFFTTALIYLKRNSVIFYTTLVLTILSSLYTAPAVLYLILKRSKKTKITQVLITLFFLIVFFANSNLQRFFIDKSMLLKITPASYSYKIQDNLILSSTVKSLTSRGSINFTRLGHNKIYYFTRELGTQLASLFNYELLTSGVKTSTILSSEKIFNGPLEKFYFWEFFLIFISILLYIKNKKLQNSLTNTVGISTMLSFILFNANALFLTLPFVYLITSQELFYILGYFKNTNIKNTFTSGFILLCTFALFNFSGRLLLKDTWINSFSPNDFAQYIIWTNFNKTNQGKGVVVTDRFGDPAFYYLYYQNVNPEFFMKNKTVSNNEVNGKVRIERIGSVSFRSFNQSEFANGIDNIWVGLSGEFTNSFDESPGFLINASVQKYSVNGKDFQLGNEVWITEKL